MDFFYGFWEVPPLAKWLSISGQPYSVPPELNLWPARKTRFVGKKFSRMAAFIRPFYGMNFLVLNKAISLGAGFPTFAELTKSFTSDGFFILNKYICGVRDHLAFSPALMTFSTVKNSIMLLTVVSCHPGISVLFLNSHVGQEVISISMLVNRFLAAWIIRETF